jgi:hypothetical protein
MVTASLVKGDIKFHLGSVSFIPDYGELLYGSAIKSDYKVPVGWLINYKEWGMWM